MSGKKVGEVQSRKTLIVGIVAAIVLIGILIGGYFIFFSESLSVEEKMRKDLNPVLENFNDFMETTVESTGLVEDVEFSTYIVEIKEVDGLWEALVYTDISALEEGNIGVSYYYYDAKEEKFVSVVIVNGEGEGDEMTFDEFVMGLQVLELTE